MTGYDKIVRITTSFVATSRDLPRVVGFLAAKFLLSSHLFATQIDIDWDKAEREIRRLPPAAFATLPIRITAELKKQGCSIPQVWSVSKPHNAIKGSFADHRQTDWAVLCSRNGKSSLLVFWGGPKRCSSNLLEAADRDFVQGVGGDVAGYSRQINAVGRENILEFYFNGQDGTLPSIDHQAIEQLFLGKTATAFYCHRVARLER